MNESNKLSIQSRLKALVTLLRKIVHSLFDFLFSRPQEPSEQSKADVKVASPRKLFRTLHDFLEDSGYEHEYEPLKTEHDAIVDVAIFECELIGKKDTPGRDWRNLILGTILFFTIVLTPRAIKLMRSSFYSLRTVATISVEGEAYRSKTGSLGTMLTETLDVVSEARVTLQVKTGVAEGDYEISRPTRVKSELTKSEEQQKELKNSFDKLLARMSRPVLEIVTV